MPRTKRASQLIETLGLTPHPEGGFYREVFRDDSQVLHPVKGVPRSALTHISFLLEAGTFSALHRVAQTELWHHVEGGPLELTLIAPAGAVTQQVLTPGQVAAVPPFWWQAARPLGDYALCGCTVAPGFDFADFELPPREALLALFPQHEVLVTSLTMATSPPP
jgi:hypothetical protein